MYSLETLAYTQQMSYIFNADINLKIISYNMRKQPELINIKRALHRINPSVLGLKSDDEIYSINKINSGEAHFNYIAETKEEKFLIRLSKARLDGKGKPTWAIKHINREYKALKAVENIETEQKVYYKDTSCNIVSRPFIIIRYIEGKPIKRLSINELKELAALLSKIHKIHHINGIREESILSYNRHYVKRRVKGLLKPDIRIYFNSSFVSQLENAYKIFVGIKLKKFRLSLIHGDVGKDNLIKSKNRIILIDWEHARLAEPQFDIATALERFNLQGRRKKLFLSEYIKNGGQSLKDLKKYQMIRSFDRLLWALWEYVKIKQNILDEEIMKIKDPRKYIKIAHYEFQICKEYGIFDSRATLRVYS